MAYNDEKLSGKNLRRCYEIASPRVKRYLLAEIGFIRPFVHPGDQVLELGCGYGRICFELEDRGAHLTGIDTARENITLARELAGSASPCGFREADALDTGFEDGQFDTVLCLQNGICAFGVEPAGSSTGSRP